MKKKMAIIFVLVPKINFGTKRSQETKDKIRKSMLGKKPSLETIEKMKLAKKNYKPQKNPNPCKKILRIDPITQETKEYESIREAERDGFHSTLISYVANGKRKLHKGYMWKFV